MQHDKDTEGPALARLESLALGTDPEPEVVPGQEQDGKAPGADAAMQPCNLEPGQEQDAAMHSKDDTVQPSNPCTSALEIVPAKRTTTTSGHREHSDGLREIRAMVMAALPCPPMPIMVCKELEGECRLVGGVGIALFYSSSIII